MAALMSNNITVKSLYHVRRGGTRLWPIFSSLKFNPENLSPVICSRCSKYYSTQQSEDKVKPPARLRRFLLDKLVNFITNSSDQLEKRIPSVFQVYRTFKTGVSGFVSDTKSYYKISTRLWSGESLENFSRKDLELYRQFSTDLPVVGLIFVIVFAPGGAAIFPLAYVFPRYLLSQHFWTPQQKVEFRTLAIRKQLKHYDGVLDYMHLLSQHIEHKPSAENVRKLISKLDSKVVLSNAEILETLPLFEGKPFNMECLSIRHSRHLSKSLGLSVRRKKLIKDALFLHFIDKAMQREGIDIMEEEELDKACYWRGLNPSGLSKQEKAQYLNKWIDISGHIHEKSISLLLHLPVLLSYCHPKNQTLMATKTINRGNIDSY
ncbi:LETM1 domain-containing protein 1-like [Physella acuta]|uniref:LETM1 domain-containing protein 1-like n=1 Tax=Physella acuta TaxID=109671 RepID=UPI0027DAEA04|nr:LETM1 domain-containing protein 1-like [Physella acuta]